MSAIMGKKPSKPEPTPEPEPEPESEQNPARKRVISYRPSPEVWAALVAWREGFQAETRIDPGFNQLIDLAVRYYLENERDLPPLPPAVIR